MNTDFGPYELRHRIGNGGMAWVWQGVQKELDLPVAIKVLYPQYAEDETFVQRFLGGARAAARLQHPNIVRIMFFGRHEAGPFIVMEFVDGTDLRHWMEHNPTPPLEVALVLLRDVARAIEMAHTHNIVHRDLKPANVMLSREGVAKLMDFDLARRLDDPMHLTQTGTALGTVHYMSPEQADGLSVGKESDLFSFGVICYELLCGVRPFAGSTESEVRRAREHEPRPMENVNPIAPTRVADIVRSMLIRDVALRCRNASDVRREFDAAVNELGLLDEAGLMAAYVSDPNKVREELSQRRRDRHLTRARGLESRTPAAENEALREYGLALHIDPSHAEARDAARRLTDSVARRILDSRGGASEPAAASASAAAPIAPETGTPEPAAPQPDPQDVEGTWIMPPPGAAASRPPSAITPAAPSSGPSAVTAHTADEPSESRRRPVARAPEPEDRSFPDPEPAGIAPPVAPARPRSRTPMLLAGGVALLAAVVAAIVVLRPRAGDEPDPASAEPPAAGAASAVTAPGSPPTPPSPDPFAAPSSVFARIAVETLPAGSLVRLDGGPLKPAPAVFDSITPGEHRVSARRDSFELSTRRLTLRAGRDTAITIALRRRSAAGFALDVQVSPENATVRLNGGEARTVPARFEGLRNGPAALEVVSEGYVTQRVALALSGLRDTTVSFRLVTPPRPLETPRYTANLRVKSSPSGAQLKLDDRAPKDATHTFKDVGPGSHTLTVSKDGYRTRHMVLTFSALKDSAFTVELERDR